MTIDELQAVFQRDLPEFSCVISHDCHFLNFSFVSPDPKADIKLLSLGMNHEIRMIWRQKDGTFQYDDNIITTKKVINKLKEIPVLIVHQPLSLYGIPSNLEIRCFLDFAEELTSVAIRFEPALVANLGKSASLQVRRSLSMTEVFHSLLYAYLFKKTTPLGILQDYIQSEVL